MRYGNEVLERVKTLASTHTQAEIAEQINREFGCAVSESSVSKLMKRYGIEKPRVVKHMRKSSENYHVYTETEKEWLKQHQDEMPRDQLADTFNQVFGTAVSRTSIKDVCTKRLKLKRSQNTGCIQSGDKRIDDIRLPVGTERIYNGYTWVKVNNIQFKGKVTSDKFRQNWCPKQVYLYEQAHGTIPVGYFVVFLDGNKQNFDLDNLYCINRRVLAMMSKNRWWTESREHTLTAIKWCELFYALRKGE